MMLAKIRKYTVAMILAALVLFFCLTAEGFASFNNLFNLLRQVSVLGIVAAGMTIVIITGNIDLSVGSLVSLVSCTVAILISRLGVNPFIACIFGTVLAVLMMTLNGVIIQKTGMPAMLCTLAVMQIYQGFAYLITGATPVTGLPESMRGIGQGYIWEVPIPVLIMSAVFLLCWLILSKTYPGRYFYAVGSNSEAARLSGISVFKTNLLAFALCGVAVGLASTVQMSRLFGGYPSAGSGLEMDVITAVVVGGVPLSGGSGKISGVIQGVLLMGVLANGLTIMGANTYTQLVFKGIVLVLVVGLDCYQRIKAKKSAKA